MPPLNLARVGIASAAAAAAPPAAPHHDRAAAGPGGAGAAAGADSHSALQAGVAELEQELAGWAAAPQWQPSSQGRWYVYPPIGRKVRHAAARTSDCTFVGVGFGGWVGRTAGSG